MPFPHFRMQISAEQRKMTGYFHSEMVRFCTEITKSNLYGATFRVCTQRHKIHADYIDNLKFNYDICTQENYIRSYGMAKQVKIKDIAKMAGVSAGTVDRILHNRGNVSASSREAVERVLKDVGYRYNIHASAISFRKEYSIAITIPTPSPGEYWGSIQTGIEHGLNEYSDISISYRYAFYNQFDIYSCRAAFGSIPEMSPDAVIIGPTFVEETRELCCKLDEMKIPYVFVDSVIGDTFPIASFTTDQYACGFLLGRLLHAMTPAGGEFAIFGTRRIGNQRANNSTERRKGFLGYLEGTGLGSRVKEASFSAVNPEENEKDIAAFLKGNAGVTSIAVMNSRGYIVADMLRKWGAHGIRLISFDLTTNNMRCINEGSISTLLCQRPEMQGFNAIRSTIHYLLYRQADGSTHHIMPIDIIMKENLPFYRELY